MIVLYAYEEACVPAPSFHSGFSTNATLSHLWHEGIALPFHFSSRHDVEPEYANREPSET